MLIAGLSGTLGVPPGTSDLLCILLVSPPASQFFSQSPYLCLEVLPSLPEKAQQVMVHKSNTNIWMVLSYWTYQDLDSPQLLDRHQHRIIQRQPSYSV